MSLSRCGSGGEALTRTLFDGARIIAEIERNPSQPLVMRADMLEM
jgi:hypothetical protein